jgi:hypothetical protein
MNFLHLLLEMTHGAFWKDQFVVCGGVLTKGALSTDDYDLLGSPSRLIACYAINSRVLY